MHVLILPSEIYVTPFYPLGGVFQYHQAHALSRCPVMKVGVLSTGLRPVADIMKPNSQKVLFENDEGIPTYRCYRKKMLPNRFYPSNSLLERYLRLGLAIFERYIREQGKPDLIHAHNALYAGVIALKIKEKYNIPYMITEHSSAFFNGGIMDCQKAIIREVFANAKVKSVVSTRLGQLLETMFGSTVCPWTTIFNIADPQLINSAPSSDRKSEGSFTFLSVGTLNRNKNHADLLKAFAVQFGDKRDIRLRIGGEGPQKAELVKLARDLGIRDQVAFLGFLTRSDVTAELRTCDAFVLPSHYETFGVVLIEALSCGKPLIATRCGGPEDIIGKNNGILVPIKDVDALGDAMKEVYLNRGKYDPQLIQDDCIARFGEEAFVKRLVALYENQ